MTKQELKQLRDLLGKAEMELDDSTTAPAFSMVYDAINDL